MRARKKFPKSVKCTTCNGSGWREQKRDVIPCRFCGHDVHFEHHVRSTDIKCLIDGCDCCQDLPEFEGASWERGEWPHP